MPPEHDPVNRPSHYAASIEPIDAIEAWGLGFALGNVVKYVARADRKGRAMEDLHKARWYLLREIRRRELANAADGTKFAGTDDGIG